MKIKDIIFQIKDLSYDEVLEYLIEKTQKPGQKTFVITINPEIIMLAMGDSEYEKVLRSANLALVDGIGVLWAGKMFGKRFNGRVHGVDLVDGVCKEVLKKPITVGFLGGKKNVAQKTAERLVEKYPGLKVAFALEEWPRDESRIKNQELRLEIHNSELITHNSRLKCDILFVAFGSPKQEMWINQNLDKIDVKVAIGVGGAFDFISGKVMRAPRFIRSLGLEWLFRLIRQPWRAKRQFALIRFIFVVLKEKFV